MLTAFLQKIHALHHAILAERDEDDIAYQAPPPRPPKILYHVTKKKNVPSILKHGLIPRVGEITKAGHGKDSTPLVYLLEYPAPLHGQQAAVLEVDPAANDIWYFDGVDLWEISLGGQWRQHDGGDIPKGVEPGDYFSESKVKVKRVLP